MHTAVRPSIPPPPVRRFPIPAGRDEQLAVKSEEDIKALAETLHDLVDHGRVPVLRAVGAAAVNQAVKATALASALAFESSGYRLMLEPSFISSDHVVRPGTTDDNEITLISLRVVVIR